MSGQIAKAKARLHRGFVRKCNLYAKKASDQISRARTKNGPRKEAIVVPLDLLQENDVALDALDERAVHRLTTGEREQISFMRQCWLTDIFDMLWPRNDAAIAFDVLYAIDARARAYERVVAGLKKLARRRQMLAGVPPAAAADGQARWKEFQNKADNLRQIGNLVQSAIEESIRLGFDDFPLHPATLWMAAYALSNYDSLRQSMFGFVLLAHQQFLCEDVEVTNLDQFHSCVRMVYDKCQAAAPPKAATDKPAIDDILLVELDGEDDEASRIERA